MTDSNLFGSPADAVRTRAVRPDDKAERRARILDAAEHLLAAEPNRLSVMADVASAAGIAKGTVYLYFPSKEALLLELHERHVGDFFSALNARLAQPDPAALSDLIAITRKYILTHPTYLTCASVCMGSMERGLSVEQTVAHLSKVAQALERAGAALERHFPSLAPGDGIRLLRTSYGLMLGMWQLLQPAKCATYEKDTHSARVMQGEFHEEVERALNALWAGWVGTH